MTIPGEMTPQGSGPSGAYPGRALSGEALRLADAYLEKLREGLRGLNEQDSGDIVEELRSHILEKAASENGSVTAMERSLGALGSAQELARQYMTDDLLARAARSWSPLLFLRGLVGWASLSAAGIWVLLGCVIGYVLGGSFILSAILKPVHPQTAGFWVLPGDPHNYSLRLGFGAAPLHGKDVLGWWIVPLGLLVGGGLCLLTTQVGLWFVRQFRKSSASQRVDSGS